MRPHLTLVAIAPLLLAGCNLFGDKPDPLKLAAEGKAIGAGCRHAGRGVEDCFKLNPSASKAAVFDGWKEMNEYMDEKLIDPQPPSVHDAKAQRDSTQADKSASKPNAKPPNHDESKARDPVAKQPIDKESKGEPTPQREATADESKSDREKRFERLGKRTAPLPTPTSEGSSDVSREVKRAIERSGRGLDVQAANDLIATPKVAAASR